VTDVETPDVPGRELSWSEKIEARLEAVEAAVKKGSSKTPAKAATDETKETK
jgi:hypothetical protein